MSPWAKSRKILLKTSLTTLVKWLKYAFPCVTDSRGVLGRECVSVPASSLTPSLSGCLTPMRWDLPSQTSSLMWYPAGQAIGLWQMKLPALFTQRSSNWQACADRHSFTSAASQKESVRWGWRNKDSKVSSYGQTEETQDRLSVKSVKHSELLSVSPPQFDTVKPETDQRLWLHVKIYPPGDGFNTERSAPSASRWKHTALCHSECSVQSVRCISS